MSKYKYCTCTFLEKQIGDIESHVASGLETRKDADYRIECLMLDDKFNKLREKAMSELDRKHDVEREKLSSKPRFLKGGVQ